MKVSGLTSSESARKLHFNPNEVKNLEKLKARVERAMVNCRLSRNDRDDIMRQIYADGKVSPEECEIWRSLQEKIWEGEIQID
ncbi:MAG: hypothetical protein WBB29_10110 [Geitlerinemataceae cyanobacterium]